jgi:hypothetical protein
MTLFAPDDLPLDDLLKLENRLRELSAALPPRRDDGSTPERSAIDEQQLPLREVNLAPSLPVLEQAVEPKALESEFVEPQAIEPGLVGDENAVTERFLSELEEFAARSANATPAQPLASRLLSKFRPNR